MNQLNNAERALVALGAALGSNCVPCVQVHVPAARLAGLTDTQISEALEVADQVRQVPARNVLEAARELVAETAAADQTKGKGFGCRQPFERDQARASCCP